jgi:hypothetical protein
MTNHVTDLDLAGNVADVRFGMAPIITAPFPRSLAVNPTGPTPAPLAYCGGSGDSRKPARCAPPTASASANGRRPVRPPLRSRIVIRDRVHD